MSNDSIDNPSDCAGAAESRVGERAAVDVARSAGRPTPPDAPLHQSRAQHERPPDPSTLADGVERRLHPAFVAADRVSWWITTAVLFTSGALSMPILWFIGAADGLGLLWIAAALTAMTALLIVAAITMPRLAYRHTSYIVSPLGLEIRRGVLWRSVATVPRSRVQHTDVVQGPVARRYGLATLVVHTAGTENATVALQGLGRADAFALRDLLVRGGDGGGGSGGGAAGGGTGGGTGDGV